MNDNPSFGYKYRILFWSFEPDANMLTSILYLYHIYNISGQIPLHPVGHSGSYTKSLTRSLILHAWQCLVWSQANSLSTLLVLRAGLKNDRDKRTSVRVWVRNRNTKTSGGHGRYLHFSLRVSCLSVTKHMQLFSKYEVRWVQSIWVTFLNPIGGL